ncbi:hypothetical protein GQ53DRAFT_852103 [Thozetella sp. PMI_491]|nr:hypothetical protein GQ53DRAFT_852103 [Thozetella sp. PMI_491]
MGPRRDEVLQTNELLEQILLRLNLRTLLTAAQLVSRHWSTLISASPALQKALFFQPCTASEVSEPRFNPLLQEEFPYWLRSGTRTSRDHLNKSNLVRKPRDSPVTRPEASWRKMLPRQPPVTILGIWTQCHGMGGDHHAFSIGAESKLSSSRLHDSEPAGEDGSINPSPPLLQMRDLYDHVGCQGSASLERCLVWFAKTQKLSHINLHVNIVVRLQGDSSNVSIRGC